MSISIDLTAFDADMSRPRAELETFGVDKTLV